MGVMFYNELTIIVPILNNNCLLQFLENNSKNVIDQSIFISKKQSSGTAGIKIIIQKGKGIYGAINTGVQNCSSKYYVVSGSDDIIFLSELINAIKENPDSDIITGKVWNRERSVLMTPRWPYFYHLHKGIVSEHAVGAIISKELHNDLGLYDDRYQIAGDADFLIKAHKRKIQIKKSRRLFGAYDGGGISTKNFNLGQSELLKIISNHHSPIWILIHKSLKKIMSTIKRWKA